MSAPETGAPPETGLVIDRFSRGSRWVHWASAVFMTSCILTAAVLYNGSLAVIVGHRYLVEQIHVYSGFALPVPLVVGILSRGYRDDARRLNRFTSRDWAWLRSRSRRDGSIEVGKFNAGQKLNAALSAGSIGVLLLSGVVMYFTNLAPLPWRSGATFVHDWFALARRPARHRSRRDGGQGPVRDGRDAHRPGARALGSPRARRVGARGRRRSTWGHPRPPAPRLTPGRWTDRGSLVPNEPTPEASHARPGRRVRCVSGRCGSRPS